MDAIWNQNSSVGAYLCTLYLGRYIQTFFSFLDQVKALLTYLGSVHWSNLPKVGM